MNIIAYIKRAYILGLCILFTGSLSIGQIIVEENAHRKGLFFCKNLLYR